MSHDVSLRGADWVAKVANSAPAVAGGPLLDHLSQAPIEHLTCEQLGLVSLSHLRVAIEAPDGVDRSNDVLRAAALGVEGGYSDVQIAGLLLNPDNAISAHCRDQPNPMRAVQRAIAKAKAPLSKASVLPVAASAATNLIFDSANIGFSPTKWLIKGVLPRSGIGFLGGQSGAGKSFLAVDIAVAVAGDDAAGFFGKRISRQTGVVILAAEGGGDIGNRIVAARHHRKIERTLPLAYASSLGDLSQSAIRAEVIAALRAASDKFQNDFGLPLGLVIIDTFAAAFSIEDENANAQVSARTSHMAEIARETGALVIAVHHYGKNQESGLRGGSAFRANVDVIVAVLADRNETTGECRNRRISITKQRAGVEGPLSGFDLRFEPLGIDDDGEAVGTCIVVANDAPRFLPRKIGKPEATLEKAFDEINEYGRAEITKLRPRFGELYSTQATNPDEAKRKAFERALQDNPQFKISDDGMHLTKCQ